MSYFTILTSAGAAAIAQAQANETHVPLRYFAIGDGGGVDVVPSAAQTELVNEVHRVQISSVTVHSTNPAWVVVEAAIPADVGGWTMREVGLISDDDVLIAVGNFPSSYKPLLAEGSARDLIVRMVIEVGSASIVNLTIDPSVVLATNQSVINAVFDHEQKADPHPQYLTQPEGDARYLQVLPLSTETQRGIAELATVAEAVTGTDAERIVTPAGLSAAINARFAAERPKRFYHCNL